LQFAAGRNAAVIEKPARSETSSVSVDVSVSYGLQEVVCKLSLNVHGGEFVCLLGPSG
jgi:ABC-type Fe3+/spermidine/putrescine transport system ATPase subunit